MNDTTPHYKLPLPHPGNDGADDCLKLRLALQGLDAELYAASEQAAALMQGHARDADAHGLIQRLDALNAELQGRVDALRATLQGDFAAGLAGKADSTAMQDALALKADAATMAAELAKKSNAATVTAALATKADKAENATEHEALRGEIDAAHAKAQEALERDPLPSMIGAANKFLSTDGTQACWKTLETLAVVSPPTVEMAAQFPIGFASTVRMSAASRLTDGHVASFFVVAGGAQPVSVSALNNAASHDLSIDGEAGQLVPVKVVAVDNNGYQSETVTHNVALVDVAVAAPVLSGVVEGAVDVGLRPTVSVGPFVVSLAGFDAPRAADNVWYCFKAAGGAVIEQGRKTFAASGGDITPAENLPLLADVTLEVNWLGNKLEGAKAALGFCTLDAKVLPPSIVSPVNGATGVLLTPEIALSPFDNTGPVDTPKTTRIRVYSDKDLTVKIAEYNGAYTEKWTLTPPLALDSPFWAVAEHEGNLWGLSASSAVREFRSQTIGDVYPLGHTWVCPEGVAEWVFSVPIGLEGAEFEAYTIGPGGDGGLSYSDHSGTLGSLGSQGGVGGRGGARSGSGGGGGGGGYVAEKRAIVYTDVMFTFPQTTGSVVSPPFNISAAKGGNGGHGTLNISGGGVGGNGRGNGGNGGGASLTAGAGGSGGLGGGDANGMGGMGGDGGYSGNAGSNGGNGGNGFKFESINGIYISSGGVGGEGSNTIYNTGSARGGAGGAGGDSGNGAGGGAGGIGGVSGGGIGEPGLGGFGGNYDGSGGQGGSGGRGGYPNAVGGSGGRGGDGAPSGGPGGLGGAGGYGGSNGGVGGAGGAGGRGFPGNVSGESGGSPSGISGGAGGKGGAGTPQNVKKFPARPYMKLIAYPEGV